MKKGKGKMVVSSSSPSSDSDPDFETARPVSRQLRSHSESDSQSWPSDFLGPATGFPTTASFSIPSSLSPLRSADISFLGHRPDTSSTSVSQVQTTAAPADSSHTPVALIVSSPHHSTTPSEGETVETQESETASPAYISRPDGGNQGSSYASTLTTDTEI